MIILDTETTGLLKPEAVGAKNQPQIIDFAAVKIDNRTGEEVGRIEFLIHPGCAIPPEITKITGYKDADFVGKPSFATVQPRIAEFFVGERAMLAHNLPFDKGLLYWELVRLDLVTSFPWPSQQLCTAMLSQEEFGKRLKLIDLYERKTGKKLDQKHTAMADVEALLEVVRADRLWELVAMPLDDHTAVDRDAPWPAKKAAPAKRRAKP
jgi:DNA polymerase III epsilon subunit-like protein